MSLDDLISFPVVFRAFRRRLVFCFILLLTILSILILKGRVRLLVVNVSDGIRLVSAGVVHIYQFAPRGSLHEVNDSMT